MRRAWGLAGGLMGAAAVLVVIGEHRTDISYTEAIVPVAATLATAGLTLVITDHQRAGEDAARRAGTERAEVEAMRRDLDESRRLLEPVRLLGAHTLAPIEPVVAAMNALVYHSRMVDRDEADGFIKAVAAPPLPPEQTAFLNGLMNRIRDRYDELTAELAALDAQ